MPNKNIATPAAISLKSGLIQNPYARITKMAGKKVFLSIEVFNYPEAADRRAIIDEEAGKTADHRESSRVLKVSGKTFRDIASELT